VSNDQAGRPLDGVKVLEVAMFAFVPSSTVLLADWGAQVIKVEHPMGDPQRNIFAWGVPGEVDGIVHLFEVANRNKRAIGIDLASEQGHDILMRLVDRTDVFVTNFLPSARRKLRIEPEDIHARNPRWSMRVAAPRVLGALPPIAAGSTRCRTGASPEQQSG